MSVAARAETVPRFSWLIWMSLWMVPVFFGPGWAWLAFLIMGIVSRRVAAIVVGVVMALLAITVGLGIWGEFTGVVNAIVQLTGILIALSMNPGWLRTMWERRLARPADATSPLVQPWSSGAAAPAEPTRPEPRRGRKRRSGRAGSAAPTEADRLAARVGAGTTDLLETTPDADPPEPVDVQTATAEELQQLPGMNRPRARKAVKERTKRGGFASIEDFGEVVGLQPHEIVRLRAAATCSPRPRAERRFGRRVDY